MMRGIGVLIMLLVAGAAALAQPQFRNAGATLLSETTKNQVIGPNERVTVGLALKNVGNQAASNLVATIQEGNGVSIAVPSAQDYGLMLPYAPAVARPFSFTADAPSNTLLTVNLDLSDGGRALGMVSFRFRIGPVMNTFVNTEQIIIQDDNKGLPYPSLLNVTNAVGSIVSVSVTLSNINHAYPDDIDILLVSPAGDAVILMSDACGGTDLIDKTITFTDEAALPIPESTLPGLSFYRTFNYEMADSFVPPAPLGPYASVLSAFNGKNAAGIWQLYVMDDFIDDGGEISDGWALHITTLQPVDDVPVLRLLGGAMGNTNNVVDTIRFEVRGSPGHSYAIETSPDPLGALPFLPFVMPSSGLQTFQFPIGATNQFFRAVSEP